MQNIEKEIIEFIDRDYNPRKYFLFGPKRPVTLNTSIRDDLKLVFEDNEELLQAYFSRWRVDPGNFEMLYYFVWRVFYGAYSVRVTVSLNLALWYGIFPAFIMMALLPLRLMKEHLLLILLITALLFGFGGSTHLILCILLSFYWLLGCGLMLFMKYVVYRQVAVLLKISPL
ncbi:DUF1493 family protein [Cronobacter malonaticus]|nr:DUF1493 family protein [Cronobacter malonaticus]NCH49968.1 DUF1493 family protein [Cronobacter malonaticus]